MTTTMRLKKGDTVQMLAGKDRGKQGRILEARPRDGKVIVENLNIFKKHQKPRPIRDAGRMGGTQIAPGGIVAFHVSNRYLNLKPVVAPLAARAGMKVAYKKNEGDDPKDVW